MPTDMTDVMQFGLGGNMLQESKTARDTPQTLHTLNSSATFGDIWNIFMMTRGTIQTEKMVHILKRLTTYSIAKTSITNMLLKLHISDDKTVTSNCYNVYLRRTTYMNYPKSVRNCTSCYLSIF